MMQTEYMKDLVHNVIFTTYLNDSRNCAELKVCIFRKMVIQLGTELCLPFSKLDTLENNDCTGYSDVRRLIEECPALRRIAMNNRELKGINGMNGRRFPELREFRMFKCKTNDVIEMDALEHFIVSNLQLTILILAPMKVQTSHPICLIGKHLVKLEQLILQFTIDQLENFERDIQVIGELSSLKLLTLSIHLKSHH